MIKDIKMDGKKFKSYMKNLKSFYSKDLRTIITDISKKNVENTQNRIFLTGLDVENKPFSFLNPKYALYKRKKLGFDTIGIFSKKMIYGMNIYLQKEKNKIILHIYNNIRNKKGFPYPVVFQYGSIKQKERYFIGFDNVEVEESNKFIFSKLKEVKE